MTQMETRNIDALDETRKFQAHGHVDVVLGLDRALTEVSVQYVDHNLLQTDSRNAEDHDFLRSACQRFGLWYSKAGNGVSHPTHMQRFGIPGI